MAKRRSRHKQHYNWCDFGKHALEDGQRGRHVHPIPVCEAFPNGPDHPGDGASACPECYPGIEKLQIEQGILLVQ